MITKTVKGIETGNEAGLVTVIETVTESVRRTEGIVTRTEKESVRRRENERKRRRGNVKGKERRNEKEKKSERRKENVKGRERRSGSEETRRIATDLRLNPPEDQLHHPLKVTINQKQRTNTTTDALHHLQSLKTKRSRIHPQK